MVILCTIDLETREVSLPAGQVIASYDHNVDVIRFQAEAIPGFSLDTSSIKIAAQGPNKARHDYAVDPSTVAIEEETGYITFDWPIPAGVTEMPEDMFGYGSTGQLIFAVCAEIISGDTVSKAWHSDDGIITVVAHLEPESGGGEDPEEEATNAQKIAQLQTDVAVINTQVGALGNGSPTPVETVAEMTDESAVYLYTGSESGYTAGNWYFWNGSAWTSGGTYGGAVTDTTLSVSGAPADAKAVGDEIGEVNERLGGVRIDLDNLSLGINDADGLLYIYLNGSPIGDGVDVSGGSTGTRYTIAWSLSNVTASPKLASILDGKTLLTTITPNSGCNIQNVVVSMGNTDITSTAWNDLNETITVTNVSGNISISITAKSGYATGRLLLWEDDFDTLNTDTWGYELGYIRNGEKQYYTDDAKNCYVEDSALHLVALKDNPTSEFEWSSASIDSSYNFPNGHGFYYGNGLIETRIKIPLTSEGVWPAWWSVGVIKAATCASGSYVRRGLAWPNATEIDMLDYIGSSAVSNNITPGVIYQNDPYSISAVVPTKTPIANNGKYNLSDGEWHILGMEYTPTELLFYQDRVLISKIDISGIDNLHGNFAFPLKYNLAMGTTSGTIPAELTKAEYLVDWVRYYAPEGTQKTDVVELTASINDYPNAVNKNRYIPIYPTYSGVSRNLFLKWQSNNTSIATVYNGYLHTIANGDFTITAYDNDGRAVFSREINVDDSNVVPVTYFDITTDLTEIPAEETITVDINVLPSYATNLTAIVSSNNPYLVCNGNQITNINDTGSSITAIVHVTTVDGGYSEDVSARIASAKNYDLSDTTNILNNYTPKTFSFTRPSSTRQNWSWADSLENGNTLSYSGSYSFPQGTSAGLYSPGTTMVASTGVKKISDSYMGSLTLFMLIKKPEDSTSYTGNVMSLFSGQGYTVSSATRFSGNNSAYALDVSDMTGAYVVLCAKSTYVEGAKTIPWRFGVKVNDEEVVWTDGSMGNYYTTGGGSTGATPYGTYYGIGNTVNAIAKEIYYKQIVAYSSIKTDAECEAIMNELYTIHSS